MLISPPQRSNTRTFAWLLLMLICASLLPACTSAGEQPADKPLASAEPIASRNDPPESAPDPFPPLRELAIDPQGGEEAWKASIADVKQVLHSAAGELWKRFPDRKLHRILVRPQGGPIVFFKRGKQREYIVHLNTGEQYWSQYAYQFAHEFCHIMCSYREGDTNNKWFEESICELASLYALRQMSVTWQTSPPYPNWKGYAPKLAEYAQERIESGQLPDDQTLAQWYAKNAEALSASAADRQRNQVVATALLPLLEKDPHHWPAVEYLNAGEPVREKRDFAAYLRAWHDHVPDKHRVFVKAVAQMLGVALTD